MNSTSLYKDHPLRRLEVSPYDLYRSVLGLEWDQRIDKRIGDGRMLYCNTVLAGMKHISDIARMVLNEDSLTKVTKNCFDNSWGIAFSRGDNSIVKFVIGDFHGTNNIHLAMDVALQCLPKHTWSVVFRDWKYVIATRRAKHDRVMHTINDI